MRFITGLFLFCGLWGASFASDIVIPNQKGFNFFTKMLFGADQYPCSGVGDTFDFYWRGYEEGTGICNSIRAIKVASRWPFYVSKKPMNYSEYMGDVRKLADTSLFMKCSSSTYFDGTANCRISIAKLMSNLNGVIAGGEDSICQRLYFFGSSPFQVNIPVKIDKIYKHNDPCPPGATNPTYIPTYDSMAISYGNSVTGTMRPTGCPASPHAGLLARYRELFAVSGKSMPAGSTIKSNVIYVDGDKATLHSSIRKR